MERLKKYCIQTGTVLSAAAGIYMLLIAAMTILRLSYLVHCNKNIDLCLIAAAAKNDRAVDCNVRVDHLTVNGKDMDLSAVQIPDDSQWAYESANDFLYVYDAEKPEKLTISLKDVHTISIGLVQEVGSGIVDVYINGSLWRSEDLYKDTDWSIKELDYETSVWIFPERKLWLQGSIFIFALVISLLLEIKQKENKIIVDWLISVMQAGVLSVLLLLAISVIQYGSIYKSFDAISLDTQSFLKAGVFLFLCILLFALLSGRIWAGYVITSLISVLAVIVSKEKLLNTAVPLLPWDFFMIGEAASVIGNYQISFMQIDLLAVIALAATAVLVILISRKNTIRPSVRLLVSAVLVLLLTEFTQNSFVQCDIEDNFVEYRTYQINEYYERRGFVSAFLENGIFLKTPEQPEDYNRITMEKIAGSIRQNRSVSGKRTPTIIAVLSESFWDFDRLDTLTFEEDILPNFTALKTESRHGELFTHVINGGTVISEFEFLTGFSGEFFPQGYMAYGSFLRDGFDSAVSILNEQGYHTAAIHPYIASNYNREAAYRSLGFNELYFDRDFKVKNTVRNYISDADLYRKAIEEYEEHKSDGEPQFIFCVTMQNHGGYWGDTIYPGTTVNFITDTYGEVAKDCIMDYAAGLHESDRALAELVDYFRKAEEDIIIIYFGDHMSDAGPKDDRMLEQTAWAEDVRKYDYETHRVPFLVWSNFETQSEDLGIMEIGELLPTVFEQYGIKSNQFWHYLQDVRNVYGASDSMLVVNNLSDYQGIEEMTAQQKKEYKTYYLLQYDYIWGERYAAELWETE